MDGQSPLRLLTATTVVSPEGVSVYAADTIWAVGWYQIGIALLRENFYWAGMGVVMTQTTRAQAKRIAAATSFIYGQAMVRTVEEFQLGLNVERLKDAFIEWTIEHQPYTRASV